MADIHPFHTDEAKQLFEAIGRALSAWNYIERELAILFSSCIHFDEKFPGVRAYWAVHSFEVRLDMVGEVVTYQLFEQESLLAEWNSIYNRLSRRAKQRNKLAHGSVFNRHPRGASGTKPHFFLSPFDDAVRALSVPGTLKQREHLFPKGLPAGRLYAKDILALRETFAKDANDLRAFQASLTPILRVAASER